MKFIVILIFAFVISGFGSELHPLSDEFIDFLNQKQNSWVAGRNFQPNTSLEELAKRNGFLGLHHDPNYKPEVVTHVLDLVAIPEHFDARDKWANCPSLKRIRDQGHCGSCWAFATVEALSDRACIHGNLDFFFSAEDLLSCCTSCGNCDGGYMMSAYDFYIQQGLVSGGDGCKPYSSQAYSGVTPACTNNCRQGYSTQYTQDKHFGKNDYVVNRAIVQIQTEILTNGPIIVNFEVFSDFYNYVSGVYYHVSGNSVGYHVVKVVGWGTENGSPYWLIANSWGSWWGGLGGFFKIRRGNNECGIENYPYAAMPKI